MSTPLQPAERAYSLSTRPGWEQFVTAPPRQRPDPLTAAQVRGLAGQARAEYEERRSVWHANLGPLRTPQMRAVHEQLDDIAEANRQDGDKVKGAAVIDAYPGLGKVDHRPGLRPGIPPAAGQPLRPGHQRRARPDTRRARLPDIIDEQAVVQRDALPVLRPARPRQGQRRGTRPQGRRCRSFL
jgi:hypothetical protein